MKNYTLTIRIPIEVIDDFEARIAAKDFMADLNCSIDWSDRKRVKLQEIFDNKEPRGIEL